jgi:phenylacetate-coenzyme A ligase PaaK-like adenylate-forming protein
MGLIASLRHGRFAEQCRRHARDYDAAWTPQSRLAWQLERLNQCWQSQHRHIAAYREGVDAGLLPTRFDSIEHFQSAIPPTTREMAQTRMAELCDSSRPAERWSTTGGGTGRPTKIPAWASQTGHTEPDQWMGRRWYGVQPVDRVFMISGGDPGPATGLASRLAAHHHAWSERLMGTYRFPSLRLDDAKLRHACDELLRFKPVFLLALGGVLDAFCRVNADRAARLRALHLKVAVATGEPFPNSDTPDLVNRVLGCPCAMEYGSVETGVLGFTRPLPVGLGHFELFWRSHLVEAGETGAAGGRVVRVTSLYPRKFPLLRYEIGDEVLMFKDDDARSLTRARAILGRTSSLVTLPDGGHVHAVAFERALRAIAGVERFQVVSRGGVISLKLVAPDADHHALTSEAVAALRHLHPSLESARIEFTNLLAQTPSGHTPPVILDDTLLSPAPPHRPSAAPSTR